MEYRAYKWECEASGSTFSLDVIVPFFSKDEADSIMTEYNSRFKSGSKAVIYGDGSAGVEAGDVSEYGSFLLNDLGFKYYKFPLTTPTDQSMLTYKWYDAVLQHFVKMVPNDDVMESLPVSSTDSFGSYRDFNVKSLTDSGSVVETYFVYDNNYRSRRMGFNKAYSPKSAHYGSGTGGNNENGMYWDIYLIGVVDDGTYIKCSVSGYYNYSGSSSLSGSLLRGAPTSFELWMSKLLPVEGGVPVDPTVNDPYNIGGGESGVGGGTGDFDGKSDSIEIPDLPTASATDAGFITLFNPPLSQMRSLAAYMWSDLFDLDGWRKLFANPMDAILGLSIVPVAVPSGGTKEVKVGNISTGVSMTTASTQYVAVDCGTLNVNEYWGAYLDYEPFTKAEIYLPYIGTHAIAVDDIMGKAVHVVYHVDILSGACCAYVKCGASVLYTFIGQCSSSIPITGDNWTNVVNGVLNIAGSIGSMVATGGASAPLALGEIASTSVNAMKPSVEKSGSMSGTGGMMAIQTPYLILTRPRQAVPKNQNKYTGYPSYITKKLSSLKGYTEVESIHIEGVYATDSEMSELYSLLASGVIF